jgi:hypothetical protein
MSIFRFAFSLAAALILTRSACALSLDAFVDDGSVSSTSTVGATRNIYLSSSHAIGGGRSLSATKSGPGTGVSRLEVVDSSLGYTQGAHAGFGSVVWDGNTDPSTITKNAQTIFRRGIEVCTGNCVTVSYANEVKSLTPQFTILENEAAAAAKKVQTCYKRLGIVMSPAGSRGRGTDNTISAVRAELGNLIRECSKTNVCKHN